MHIVLQKRSEILSICPWPYPTDHSARESNRPVCLLCDAVRNDNLVERTVCEIQRELELETFVLDGASD